MREHRTRLKHQGTLSRRTFLAGTGAVVALGLTRLQGCSPAETPIAPVPRVPSDVPHYDDWHDIYAQKWTWDRISKCTHYVNCAYQRGCAWNVYVKDGIVWREEQVADYPQTNS
ncbi:MAG: hypothetical protein JRG90_12915, partial [Deltaproteobacteria bacterium]|nr:hypothetical protein [Deltaproteobacteria bacterium]